MRIDPAEYELAVAHLEAEIAQAKAQLEELVAKEANDRASLQIEKASLVLADRDLQRAERLLPQRAVAAATVDETQREVLEQRQVVQRLINSLMLIPSQRKSLEAMLAAKKAALAQAQLDLGKTVVKAPFDCRLGDLTVEVGQFLRVNEFLFESHSTARTEVEARIPLNQLRDILEPGIRLQGAVNLDAETVHRLFDFDVLVRYRSGDFAAEWKGRVARIREQIDTRTHTIRFVVAVDKPYDKVIPGERPPLVKGMYCEVELRGALRTGRIVIPRSAVRGGNVYLVNSENRLIRHRVEVAFAQSGFVCLLRGLDGGETLVVSDPTPAIEGMLVSPVTDDRLPQSLMAEATAQEKVK
ncbi:MAG: efflux RND transporter periplasmic adaptor subunit [Planctomycetota bacterium]